MPDERHIRARELLESSGTVLFFKERQLVKENRFQEAVAVIRKRMRWSNRFVVISAVLVAVMLVTMFLFDSHPSRLDYVTIASLIVMIVVTGYGSRKTEATLSEVEALVGETGSDDSQALS